VSTSLERTYRYVRLSLVGIVVLIGTSIAAYWLQEGPLGSVSAAYYTSAGPIFVGGVFAMSLALLALSGHSVGQVSLDLAAIMAPLIAVIPAAVFVDDLPDLDITCAGGHEPCVPESFIPAVNNSMTALLVTAVIGWLTALILSGVQRTFSRRIVWSLAVSGGLIAAVGSWWMFAPTSFLRAGHIVAAASFFAFIAIAALVSGRDAKRAGATGYRVVYVIIGSAIVIDLLGLLAVIVIGFTGLTIPEPWGIGPVFFGEAVALVLFAIFWIVQTIETWNDPDPAFRANAAGNRLSPAPTAR